MNAQDEVCNLVDCRLCGGPRRVAAAVQRLRRVRSQRHTISMRVCYTHSVFEWCQDCTAMNEDSTANRIAAWVEGNGLWARGIADCIREGRWR